jgi:hypothetical protein
MCRNVRSMEWHQKHTTKPCETIPLRIGSGSDGVAEPGDQHTSGHLTHTRQNNQRRHLKNTRLLKVKQF